MSGRAVPGRIGPAHPEYRREVVARRAPVLYPRSVPATSVAPGAIVDLGRGSLLHVATAGVVEGFVRIVGTNGARVEIQVGRNVVAMHAEEESPYADL